MSSTSKPMSTRLQEKLPSYLHCFGRRTFRKAGSSGIWTQWLGMHKLLELTLNLGVTCLSYRRKTFYSISREGSEKVPPQSKFQAPPLRTGPFNTRKNIAFLLKKSIILMLKTMLLRSLFSHKSGCQLRGFLTLCHMQRESKLPYIRKLLPCSICHFLRLFTDFDGFLVVSNPNNSFWGVSTELGKTGECEGRNFIRHAHVYECV